MTKKAELKLLLSSLEDSHRSKFCQMYDFTNKHETLDELVDNMELHNVQRGIQQCEATIKKFPHLKFNAL